MHQGQLRAPARLTHCALWPTSSRRRRSRAQDPLDHKIGLLFWIYSISTRSTAATLPFFRENTNAQLNIPSAIGSEVFLSDTSDVAGCTSTRSSTCIGMLNDDADRIIDIPIQHIVKKSYAEQGIYQENQEHYPDPSLASTELPEGTRERKEVKLRCCCTKSPTTCRSPRLLKL